MANGPTEEQNNPPNNGLHSSQEMTETELALDRRAALAQLSMKSNLMVTSLLGLGEVIRALSDFSKDKILPCKKEGRASPLFYPELVRCTSQLLKLLSVDRETASQETLDHTLDQTEECAATLQRLTREFRGRVGALQDGQDMFSNHVTSPVLEVVEEEELESDAWSDSDSLEDYEDEPDEENKPRDVAYTNPIKAQLDEWADSLDQVIFKLDLAVKDQQLGTIADLVARFSSRVVCTDLPTRSPLVAIPSGNSACALHRVLSCFFDALPEVRNPPTRSASLVARTFKADVVKLGADARHFWDHIERLEQYRSPIIVTAMNSQVNLTLFAPESTLNFATATWQRLQANLESLKPLLRHLGADLTFSSEIEGKTFRYQCTLTLPSENQEKGKISEGGVKIRGRDSNPKERKATYPPNPYRVLDVSDSPEHVGEPPEHKIQVLTHVTGLEHPDNRARLGRCIPAVVRIAETMGIAQILATPEPLALMRQQQGDEGPMMEAYETGYYPVTLLSARSPLAGEPQQELDDLRELAAYLTRYQALGGRAESIASPPAQLLRQIRLPLVVLEDPRAVKMLQEIAELTRIDGLDLTAIRLEPDHCKAILERVLYAVRLGQPHLSESLKTSLHCFIAPSADGSPVIRLAISDRDYTPAIAHEFPLTLMSTSQSVFPHEEMSELYRALHKTVLEVIDDDPSKLNAVTLRSTLLSKGFDVCDEILIAVCQWQYQFDKPMSHECLSEALLRYLTIQPAGFLVWQPREPESKDVKLIISSERQEGWLRLLGNHGARREG